MQSFLIIINSIFKVFYVDVLQYYCYQESIFSLSHVFPQVFDNFIVRDSRDLLPPINSEYLC